MRRDAVGCSDPPEVFVLCRAECSELVQDGQSKYLLRCRHGPWQPSTLWVCQDGPGTGLCQRPVLSLSPGIPDEGDVQSGAATAAPALP